MSGVRGQTGWRPSGLTATQKITSGLQPSLQGEKKDDNKAAWKCERGTRLTEGVPNKMTQRELQLMPAFLRHEAAFC